MCNDYHTCPMYKKGKSEACMNCSFLKNAEHSVILYRVGLIIALIAFTVTTSILY